MSNPVDFVVTWVDGSDAEWQKEKCKWEAAEKGLNQSDLFETWYNNPIRYRDWDNLQYWFRGVEKFTPWVRKVHFVTWGHLPAWLNCDNPKLHIVKHTDFIPAQYLPTFNSHTIEWNMHRIEGLAEQFVYFNDDMYLIRPTKEECFFKNGLPCETAASDCIAMDWNIGHAEIKNAQIINKHFHKKECLLQHPGKWFLPFVYGKQFFKTIMLMPWDQFTGFYETHLCNSYLKKMFTAVWEAEYDVIDATCRTKFRNDANVSHWLVKNWQLVSGQFIPRSPSFGRMFLQEIDAELCSWITKQKSNLVCINDVDCSEEEFLKQKQLLIDAFQTILPEKSSFEK